MKFISVLFFFCLVSALSVLAQHSHQEYLDAHNAARAKVGVGPLIWDDKVAAYAHSYAVTLIGTCSLIHSGGPYGENLAWSSGELSGTEAVQMWVDEQGSYNYESNSCQGDQPCLHYTQVVWRNSVRLGCANVTCDNGSGTFINCNYDPPGNYVGRRPY